MLVAFVSANWHCSQNRGESSGDQTDEKAELARIDVKTFDELAREIPEVVILDIRTPEETAEGIIPGAIELDYYGDSFEQQLDSLNRDLTYLVYCRSGNRSGKTWQQMTDMGFKNVYDLEGGYSDWAKVHGIPFSDE